jgi:signal transduction histidine kinase
LPKGSKPRPSRPSDDPLAEAYLKMRAASAQCGRILHDDVGPLLTATGLYLQLLRMDHPETDAEVRQAMQILDQALDRIRAVSHELAPSPTLRGGLKNALERLMETLARQAPEAAATLEYATLADIPEEAACALYEAAAGAIGLSVGTFGAKRVKVSVRGSRSLSIRIADDGAVGGGSAGRASSRAKALRGIFRMAGLAEVSGTVVTRKSTIVLLRYAIRRTVSGRP